MSAILLALATGSATAGSRAAAATACPGKLFEMTAGGRLDTEIRDHDEGPETEEAFLCSAEGGRPFRIEGPLGSGFSLGVSGLAFAGKQAALAFEYGSIAAREFWVIDLAGGHRVFKKVLPEVPAHPESLPVGRTVLKRDDSVAWTELVPNGTYEVLEHTSRGTKVLDSSHTTRRYSLKLSGSKLSWLELDGQTRTATLE